MRSILVPIEDSPSVDSQLEAAALVAEIFNAHIDGATPSWLMGLLPVEGALDPVAAVGPSDWLSAEKWEAQIAESERRFREFVERRGIAWEDPLQPTDHPTANWLKAPGSVDRVTSELARLYDLTVLGRPVRTSSTPRAALLEAVLFESGRPILVTPPTPPQRLGDVILIAWNGSTESARAITCAWPLLAQAQRVVVLSVEGGMVNGPNAGEVERALRRDGIAADATGVRPNGLTTGEAILKEAADQGADLLVKGAYTHSRLRQMIFGGATRHILQEANLPVLMSH
jgi:nucleotide-binding universal stress UspA family protein